MDEKRRKSAQKLLDAAHEFWLSEFEAGQRSGAVKWLTGSQGELIIFTREEYREELLENIWTLHQKEKIHLFGEEIEEEEEE